MKFIHSENFKFMEKIWLKSYQSGVPAEIDPSAYSSLVDMLTQACEKFSEKAAFANFGTYLTYDELYVQSGYLAAYFQKVCHLKKGDRVAIMLPNVLQYPITLLAALRAGLIVVNINPLYTAHELQRLLIDSSAIAIVILANSTHVLAEVINQTSIKHVITTEVGDLLAFPHNYIINFWIKYIKQKKIESIPNTIIFRKALDEGAKLEFSRINLEPEDIALLQYTGGTTGHYKAAILTHRNLVANVLQAAAWISPVVKDGEEIIITPLPLYHIFSLLANCLLFMKIGAMSVLITNPRDVPGFIKELKKYKFTAITGVSTLYNSLLENKNFNKLDFSHLKISLGGGMAVPRVIAERWLVTTGCPLALAYGLTEASPAVTIYPLNRKEFTGSAGLPIPSTNISIRNEQKQELPLGEVGELWVKGPQVMRGYWQNPIESHQVLTDDGWLLTGDLAYVDSDGFVFLVDRKKNLILVSGFNVYPSEVEEVIDAHPKVVESAVIGEPDPVHGDIVVAFIVKRDPTLTEKEILDYCYQQLTGYKVPKKIIFCNDLPKSYVGKVLHRELRK